MDIISNAKFTNDKFMIISHNEGCVAISYRPDYEAAFRLSRDLKSRGDSGAIFKIDNGNKMTDF